MIWIFFENLAQRRGGAKGEENAESPGIHSRTNLLPLQRWIICRKTAEPIALACGAAVRTLQEFLSSHVWDHLRMRDKLQQRLVGEPALAAAADLGAIGVLDT